MTIVDPNHPKATFTAAEDELPTYSADAPSTSGSRSTEPLFPSSPSFISTGGPSSHPYQPYQPVASGSSSSPLLPATGPLEPSFIADLNPEMRKKLQNEVQDRGYQVEDFGFGAEASRTELPTFAETEVDERPDFAMDGSGNVISHDPKLNSNPTALLRFLRLHSASPPSFSIHLRGSHIETRDETTWHTGKHGRQHQTTRQVRDEVEDFSFSISADECVQGGLGSARGGGGAMRGVLYPVGPWEAVQRGGAWATRQATPQEQSEGAIRLEDEEAALVGAGVKEKWRQARWRVPGLLARRRMGNEKAGRERRGHPLFVHPSSLVNSDDDHRTGDERQQHPAVLFKSHFVDLFESHSSVSLNLCSVGSSSPLPTAYDAQAEEREARDSAIRQIVEDYCACKHKLKELRIEKELYGWNLINLEAGLRSITTRNYGGTVQISFRITPTAITCRPDNFWSRLFSLNIFYKLLLWLCLVYPALLLFECFFGRRWNNLRASFALTRWRRLPLQAQQDGEVSPQQMLDLAATLATRRPPKISQLPGPTFAEPAGSWVYLVGTQEGEWVKKWELAVVKAVQNGLRGVELGEEDLTRAEQERRDALTALRGYADE